jgi:putative membrane protein
MTRKFLAAAAAFAAGALLSGSTLLAQMNRTGPAQENPTTTDPATMSRYGSEPAPAAAMSGQLSSSDASFLRKAAEGGAAEVELGNLARDRATDPDVKQFAQKMVDDHSKANEELKELARKKGVAISASPDSKSRKEMDRLSKLSGSEFDRAYAKLMVSDHEKDVSEFNKQSRSAQDPDVKNFAAKTLPTLQDHLRMAREDNSKIAKGEKPS